MLRWAWGVNYICRCSSDVELRRINKVSYLSFFGYLAAVFRILFTEIGINFYERRYGYGY